MAFEAAKIWIDVFWLWGTAALTVDVTFLQNAGNNDVITKKITIYLQQCFMSFMNFPFQVSFSHDKNFIF